MFPIDIGLKAKYLAIGLEQLIQQTDKPNGFIRDRYQL